MASKKKDAEKEAVAEETTEVVEAVEVEEAEDEPKRSLKRDTDETDAAETLREMLHAANEEYANARNPRTQAHCLGQISALQAALKAVGSKDRLPRFYKGESERLGL